MIVSGLWHGANWTFVGFGAVNGIALAVHKAWLRYTKRTVPKGFGTPPWSWKTPLTMLMTINLYSFSLLLFRTPNFETFGVYVSRMFSFVPGIHKGATLFVLPLVVLSFVLDMFQYTGAGRRIFERMNFATQTIAFGILFALVLIAGSDNSIPFIYFQF